MTDGWWWGGVVILLDIALSNPLDIALSNLAILSVREHLPKYS